MAESAFPVNSFLYKWLTEAHVNGDLYEKEQFDLI